MVSKHSEPEIAHKGPKKVKTTPKLKQNWMWELEETNKTKVVYCMSRPHNILNLTLTLPYSYESPISSFIQCQLISTPTQLYLTQF